MPGYEEKCLVVIGCCGFAARIQQTYPLTGMESTKSEKILADFFFRRNILYKYEKPLYLKGYGTVYPDFTFFSKRTGQEISWEHEGMMDRQEYARSAVRKIESYQKNEIYPGDRLILTFETEQSVLNSNIIERLVNKYLLFNI